MSRLGSWGLVVVVGLYFVGFCRAQELDLRDIPESPAKPTDIQELPKHLPQEQVTRNPMKRRDASDPASSEHFSLVVEEESPLPNVPVEIEISEIPFPSSGGGRAYPVDDLVLSIRERSPNAYSANPLQVANAQRQQLINSLQALQDTYCRNAQLDEALAVRNMIRQLKQQAAQANSLPEPVIAVTSTLAPESVDVRSLRGQNEKAFYRKVTGTTGEYTWGGEDNVYTDDSALSSAAVHSGVLKEGETAIVRLTILPGRNSYPGISRNGVTTRAWQSWGGSYRIDGAAKELTSVYDMRGQDKPPFAVYVVGSLSGIVYGTGSYTDDSDLGTAAVHAGLLKPGEAGFVMVTLEGGKSSYESSTQNGVKSYPYGSWGGGFRLSAFEPTTAPAKELRLQPGFQLDVF